MTRLVPDVLKPMQNGKFPALFTEKMFASNSSIKSPVDAMGLYKYAAEPATPDEIFTLASETTEIFEFGSDSVKELNPPKPMNVAAPLLALVAPGSIGS